jgi:hypothetical protein
LRVFFGRHQMPLFSRCSLPMRARSLMRWQLMMPSLTVRTMSGVAVASM